MAEEIHTHTVARGFANADEVVLVTTPTTRTVLRPAIHAGGIRGYIIRQKKSTDGTWADTNDVNFAKLPPDSGVSIELNTEGTKILHERLSQLYEVQGQGIGHGDQEFVVGRKDEVLVIDDTNKHRAIQELLNKGYSEEVWDSLTKKDPDLATRLAAAQVQVDRESVIKLFDESLVTEKGNEAFWQKFFETYPWILEAALSASMFMMNGETYLGGKLPDGRNGVGGVATDYLFGDESTKSFAVVDIKKPDSDLVGPIYRGTAGSGQESEIYSMHHELSGGLVQVRTQITVAVEDFQSVLGKGYENINRVHPRGVLISGTLADLTPKQADSFNQFRKGFGDVTVITYDEVLSRIKKLYGLQYVNPAPTAEGDKISEPVTIEDTVIDLEEIPF
ncbi:MAG: Shedu immune nuclease family protein [Candidatus Saccharimonadales bacterium]